MKTLGLDIGTTSISAVIFQEKTGVLEAKTIANGTFLPSKSWERLQDPAAIWQKAFRVVSELLLRHPDVQAIGVTGQMHGIVYLDTDGEAVSCLYTWQDGRGDLPFEETSSWAEHLSAVSGYPLSTGYGMATHFYNLHHGLVPENAVCLCTIGDYIAMKLAGLTRPRIEPTNGASLGLFHLGKCCFDPGALLRAEIDEAILPEIVKTPLLGTGALGIPVYAAIGDNQAAFLGAVGDRQDALLVNVGTGSQVAVYSSEYMSVSGLETRPFPDGGWLLVGASLCGGRSYALLESFFRQTVKMVTGSEQSAYAAMDRVLAEAGNVEDVPCTTTTFQGTRQDANLRGSICGISIDNFTPTHLMHSFMNGMAQELYGMYRSFLDAGGSAPETIIGSGNGLRKNVHLCRIFEAVFGCPLILSSCEEEAACGAAMYAARHENTRRS
ncbi:MAG: sedoheptulokinase [Candidatus Limivicinus sp.]